MSESLEEMAARMSPPSHIVFTSPDRAVFRSEDRLTLTVLYRFHGEDYRAVLLRPEGLPWGDADCVLAMNMVCDIALSRLERGGRSETTARRIPLGAGWWLYTWVNTGPPTWYYPRLSFRRGLMVGWIRGAVAVSIRKNKS